MVASRRIILNVIATYGRSLYALVVGLFTSRWVLLALGDVDYGLFGLVGGLVTFVAFVNNLLSSAVVRFYAVKVGAVASAEDRDVAIEECKRWFNTALMIHTVIPFALVAVGYPIGDWAVRNFLTIPADRIPACVWVWRFTCLSCLVAMVNVPFQAMYTAKQEIAELTIYSFVTTTINAVFFYYMVSHADFWLVKYSLWMCLAGVIPQILIGVNAVLRYRECRFKASYLFSVGRVKSILSYAAARLWNALGDIFSGQGMSVLVNKFLGPSFNASMTLGSTVANHSTTLSGAIGSAFWPAIANTAGAGDMSKVKNMTFRLCRIGTLMLIIFALPLSVEIHEVLRLWLKRPPVFAAEISLAMLICLVLSNLCDGYWMAVMGIGKGVWKYNFYIGWAGFLRFAIAFVFFLLGLRMWGVWLAIVIGSVFVVFMRLYLGQILVGLSARQWFKTVFLPIAILVVLAGGVALIPRFMMPPSFGRVCVTTFCCFIALIPCAWRIVLREEERTIVLTKIKSKFLAHKGRSAQCE